MPRKLQSITSSTDGNIKWVHRVYDDGAIASRQIDVGTGKTLWTDFYDGRGHVFRKDFEGIRTSTTRQQERRISTRARCSTIVKVNWSTVSSGPAIKLHNQDEKIEEVKKY